MDEKILSFLIEARKNTYASGKKPKKIANGNVYSIKRGNLEYRDTFFDQERFFQGQEIIFKNSRPIWSTSYRGAAVEGNEAKEVFGYLQKILREHSDKVRLLGKKEYSDGNWRYQDKCDGNLDEFFGEEKIYFKEKIAHWMKYFGGEIK